MNSLFQQLMGTQTKSQLPSNIRSMIQNFKMLSNPQQYVQQAVQNNPQLQSILQASNGNYEQAFRNMCKERGINADEFMKNLNG